MKTVSYESRTHRFLDLLAGLIWTSVGDRWHCDSCNGVTRYLNRQQLAEWEKSTRRGVERSVECGAFLRFRGACKGRVRPVEAVGR